VNKYCNYQIISVFTNNLIITVFIYPQTTEMTLPSPTTVFKQKKSGPDDSGQQNYVGRNTTQHGAQNSTPELEKTSRNSQTNALLTSTWTT